MELDLNDACEGRSLTEVEDTIRGATACSEGTLVFAAGALALRVAGRRVVCGALLASSGGKFNLVVVVFGHGPQPTQPVSSTYMVLRERAATASPEAPSSIAIRAPPRGAASKPPQLTQLALP